MIPWHVPVPQAREAPRDVVRRLREINPDAVLVHLRQNLWQYGFYRPSEALYQDGAKKFARWQYLPAARIKAKAALIRMAGVIPSQVFAYDDLDGRIVHDVSRARWNLHHLSDDEMFRTIDAADEQRKALAAAQMRDSGRAREAHKHAFTLSHGFASLPNRSRDDLPVKAGRVRHSIPSSAA